MDPEAQHRYMDDVDDDDEAEDHANAVDHDDDAEDHADAVDDGDLGVGDKRHLDMESKDSEAAASPPRV